MNKKVLLIVIAWLSLVLTACDTRDDYFYEHCDEPTVTFTTSDSDSVTVSGKRYVQIVLNWNETKKLISPYTTSTVVSVTYNGK